MDLQQCSEPERVLEPLGAHNLLNDGGGERLGARERRDNALSAKCSVKFPVRNTQVYIQYEAGTLVDTDSLDTVNITLRNKKWPYDDRIRRKK